MKDISYYAGFFDGEGCITLLPVKATKTYVLYVAIGLTNKEILLQFQHLFGGSIYKQKREKPTWQWTLTTRKALRFLKMIHPHLQIKKAQAKLGIKFQEHKTYPGNYRLEAEYVNFEQEAKKEMTRLNH